MSAEHKLNGEPLQVLLIEDSEDDALLLERHLERAGFSPAVYRVDTEGSMRRALAMKPPSMGKDHAWDVVLADYHLPRFSAPAALKVLKDSGTDLPFIVLSGAVSEETAVDAMRAGAHDYVSKQNLARLGPAIRREVGEAEARRGRREAEAALLLSEARFHHLVDAIPLGLLIRDNAGGLLYANRAVARLLDYPLAELYSRQSTLKAILDEAAHALPGIPEAQPSPAQTIPPFETYCTTRQGGSIPVLVGVTALNPEAPPEERQMAIFLVDLTEQRRSQEAVRRTEKLAATGRLAASIAHEINNPLEAVTNCLYLMQQTNLNPTALRYLGMAQQELDRVIHITTQTLRFYRQSLQAVETDIHELLETALALYDRRLRAFGVETLRDYSNVPKLVIYDGEIRQIFANLIGNAIDAMQGVGGKLTLRTASSRDWQNGRRGVTISVADSGEGMDRSTVKRIFEPFFSTKGSTGTGLGLWVSREILSKHLGRIQVRSRPTKTSARGWTVFRVFLPYDIRSMKPRLAEANMEANSGS
jgi:signal transduction histidine kinase